MDAKTKQKALKLIKQKKELQKRLNSLEMQPSDKWTGEDELELRILKREIYEVESVLNYLIENRKQ